MESTKENLLRQLQDLVSNAGRAGSPEAPQIISTGSMAIDQRLPERGLRRGSLVEWLSEASGSGATFLALRAARETQSQGGAIIIIDQHRRFYPPAAAACHVDLANTIVVHPANDKEEQWALDQSLRCEHAAAVLAWPRRIDGRTFRRLQLAVERSGSIGLLIRNSATIDEPSWADVRLLVSPRSSPSLTGTGFEQVNNWQLAVRILRCRGQLNRADDAIEVTIDEQTGDINETLSGRLAFRYPAPRTSA